MEYIIAIVSFVVGWGAGKFLDYSLESLIEKLSIKRRRKEINKQTVIKHKDVIELCTGVPYFSCEHIDVELSENNGFYLAFPKELMKSLPKSAGSFHSQDTLLKPLAVPGYSNEQVLEILEASRMKIATQFVQRKDGLYFNGSKYGIAYADGFSRTDDSVENPILLLKLFHTDHFTHRVVEEMAEQLNINEELIKKELNHQLNWIRTSLGLSVIVVLKRTNQILMTRRSSNSSFSEGKTWIYVSATETFTDTDYDSYIQNADLSLCLKRGILEELGITQNMYYDSTLKFYSMFYETHFYQDGIVASVELKDTVTFDEILNLNAKDKELEVDSMFLIDNSKHAINKFIEENAYQMRSQTIYALRTYAARLKK